MGGWCETKIPPHAPKSLLGKKFHMVENRPRVVCLHFIKFLECNFFN